MTERIIVGPIATNAYIFSISKKECIFIDPGADALEIVKRSRMINMIPKGILLTHAHLDHMAAIPPLLEELATRNITVPVAIHREAKDFTGAAGENWHRKSFALMGPRGEELFEELYQGSMPEITFFFEEGDLPFDSSLKVIHTPGHSPGSCCFYDQSRECLFSGDTLFFKGTGRTDLPGGDARQLQKSIEEKLYPLPAQTRIYPGHGPLSTIEREIRSNPFGTYDFEL